MPSMIESVGPVRPASHRILNEALHAAVVAAGHAPSAHERKPWRWRVTNGVLDLFAVHDRTPGTRPDERLVTISCGAALHHARLALAERGWRVTVTRRPDPADPEFLARLCIDGSAPVSPDTAGLAQAIRQRRTDTRPVTGAPIEPEQMRTITTAFEAQHVHLAVLRPDQILELTTATALAIAHDRAATFVVLHGPGDEDLDWLHAGEALSAGSLVATGLGVSVLPLSAPIEDDQARALLRHALPELGNPYLVMRWGRHDTGEVAPGPTGPKWI